MIRGGGKKRSWADGAKKVTDGEATKGKEAELEERGLLLTKKKSAGFVVRRGEGGIRKGKSPCRRGTHEEKKALLFFPAEEKSRGAPM